MKNRLRGSTVYSIADAEGDKKSEQRRINIQRGKN